MSKITVIGMGPGSPSHLTMDAFERLTKGVNVFLRTSNHPVVRYLVANGMRYKALDHFYESEESFEATYQAIANTIIEEARKSDVIYAVPGNPFVAEKTVQLIMEVAQEEHFQVDVVHGVSFIDAMITALHYDPVHGLDIQDALSATIACVQPRMDQLWIQVYNVAIASQLKLLLMGFYDDEDEVVIVQAAGIPELEHIIRVKLYEMDRHLEWYNHLTSIFVPKPLKRKRDIHDLVEIMKLLRSEKGCPWDREQTHQSLTPCLIEEAYEVQDAVLSEDDFALVDELGDVLLQIVFHSTIAEEDGYFELTDVYEAICEKMVRRHPHVFGDLALDDAEAVLKNWQAIKSDEKNHASIAADMAGVTRGLPSLLRAVKVQKKASDVGFDWIDTMSAIEKIYEELEEFKVAINGQGKSSPFEEMGDLLLIVSNVARLQGIDPEAALHAATEKFTKRFGYVEQKMKEANKPLNTYNLNVMETLWLESKKSVKS